MNFGRISERLMKLAVSMNYLKLMRQFLHLFTVLVRVSETGYSHLSPYRSFSLTCIWWAAMQISKNKRKFLLEKRVQCPKDFFYTSTWPPFFCFVHQYGRRDVM